MADFNLTVGLKPDTREIEKELQKKRDIVLGTTAKGGRAAGTDPAAFLGLEAALDRLPTPDITGEAPEAPKEETPGDKKTGEILTGGFSGIEGIFKKILGPIGTIAVVVSALEAFLKPVFNLLKAIITLLFLPLVPILIPVLKLLGKFITFMMPIVRTMTDSMQRLVGLVQDSVDEEGGEILTRVQEAFEEFKEKFAPVAGKIGDFIFGAFKVMGGLGNKIFNLVVEVFLELGGLGNFLFELVVSFFKVLGTIGKVIFDKMILAWQFLFGIGKWLFDNIIRPGWEFMLGVGKLIWGIIKAPWIWLAGKIRSIVELFKFGRGSGGSTQSVGDAVISPSGNVITTNPRDFLIATTDPSSLASGTSISFAPTIHINGGINSDMDVKKIAQQIADMGLEELSRRTNATRI